MALKIYTPAAVTVTTAGTRVEAVASTSRVVFSSISFQAASANTNGVYIGDATVTSANGIRLTAGQVYNVAGDNRHGFTDEMYLDDFWFDSDANGNKVVISYLKQRN